MKSFLLSISNLLVVTGNTLVEVSNQVHQVLRDILAPCLSVVGSIGVIYMIILGINYAKSESADKKTELKKRIVNLIIGLVVIIILITVCLAVDWSSLVPTVFGYFSSGA